jgi:uncharacterized protein YjbJ (UPF0337 family)
METENQRPEGEHQQSLKGKAEEVTGWATGDRELEAKGRADGEPTDETEEEVRTEHGDKGIAER